MCEPGGCFRLRDVLSLCYFILFSHGGTSQSYSLFAFFIRLCMQCSCWSPNNANTPSTLCHEQRICQTFTNIFATLERKSGAMCGRTVNELIRHIHNALICSKGKIGRIRSKRVNEYRCKVSPAYGRFHVICYSCCTVHIFLLIHYLRSGSLQ